MRLNRFRVIPLLVVGAALAPAGVAGAATSSDTTQLSVTAGTLGFATAPDVPDLPGVTLNGSAQTAVSTMSNWSAADATGSGAGWNVTVSGDSSGGHSAVFKQWCASGPCGSDPTGYVSGGATLAADSLTLNSTGAAFNAQNGTTGTAPTHQCASGCAVDHATAVKVASAAANAGMGTWQAGSYGTNTSISLALPTTTHALTNGEVYHADLVWTLTSGP